MSTNVLQEYKDKLNNYHGTLGINPYKLLCYNMLLDTIFYLPNRFRHILLCNGLRVDCTTSESALLGIMKEMFNIEGSLIGNS